VINLERCAKAPNVCAIGKAALHTPVIISFADSAFDLVPERTPPPNLAAFPIVVERPDVLFHRIEFFVPF
jgi:hypothetical protein